MADNQLETVPEMHLFLSFSLFPHFLTQSMLISSVLIVACLQKASGSLPTRPFCPSDPYFSNSGSLGKVLPFKLDWLTSSAIAWEESCGWALLSEGQTSWSVEPFLESWGLTWWEVVLLWSCSDRQSSVFRTFMLLWLQEGREANHCLLLVVEQLLWPSLSSALLYAEGQQGYRNPLLWHKACVGGGFGAFFLFPHALNTGKMSPPACPAIIQNLSNLHRV